MKLKNVQILGFRSIDDITIPLEGYGHKVLVGKNESGKSSILKALRLLPDGIFNHSERKRMYAEEASVIFQFTLEQGEFVKCKDAFTSNFFADEGTKLTSIHTVESFYERRAKILYTFDVDEQGKWNYWGISDNVKINGGWHYINQIIPGIDIPPDSYIHDSFIQKKLSNEQASAIKSHLSVVKAKDINKKLHDVIKDTLELQNPPISCAYWEYTSNECDLPDVIDMDVFSQNSDSCLPLKRMFSLSGYQENDIQKEIGEAKAGGYNSMKSLLDKVNRVTNEYINNNWQEYNKEYRDVKIELRKDGNNIAIGISDSKNTYDFAQRSDGFRRFISFLLLMTGKEDSLILLDEPETGLHPSSAKDLRDLLIKLGKQNIIIYATHSISMIDTENIKNNLITRKENENTSLNKDTEEDGISSGELVYKALGYSIYEDLKKKNILLEGRHDKTIFKLFIQGEEWKDFGICYTDGVSKIKSTMSLLELMNREYYVLSDADEAAEQSKKNASFNKNWYTYKDLGSEAITLEDFYKKDFFNNITKSMLDENNVNSKEFPFEDIPDNGRVIYIEKKLTKITTSAKISKTLKNIIKSKCAEEATEEDIDTAKLEPVLSQFLKKITAKNS